MSGAQGVPHQRNRWFWRQGPDRFSFHSKSDITIYTLVVRVLFQMEGGMGVLMQLHPLPEEVEVVLLI